MSLKRRNDTSVQALREETSQALSSIPEASHDEEGDLQTEIAQNMAAGVSKPIFRIKRRLPENTAGKDKADDPLPTNFFDIPTLVPPKPLDPKAPGDETSNGDEQEGDADLEVADNDFGDGHRETSPTKSSIDDTAHSPPPHPLTPASIKLTEANTSGERKDNIDGTEEKAPKFPAAAEAPAVDMSSTSPKEESVKRGSVDRGSTAKSFVEGTPEVTSVAKDGPATATSQKEGESKTASQATATAAATTGATAATGASPFLAAAPGSAVLAPLFASAPPTIVQTPVVATPFTRKGENEENENIQPVDTLPALSFPSGGFAGSSGLGAEDSGSGDRQMKKPTSFPGEEGEQLAFSDFNITLLKCVNTASEGEKAVYKYQSQGHGCVRVLRDTKDGRLVVRQTGTWKVLLNSPLEYVERLEAQVTASSSYLLKFTAADAAENKLFPYCLKFVEASQRDLCLKALQKSS